MVHSGKKSGFNAVLKLLRLKSMDSLWLILVTFTALISSVANIILAFGVKSLIDFAVSHNTSSVINCLKVVIIVIIISTLNEFFRSYSSGRYTEYKMFDIRKKSVAKINSLPVSYLENKISADLISRLTNDINQFQGFIQGSFFNLICQPIIFTAAVIALLFINWKLSLFSFALIPLLMYLTVKLSKPIEKNAMKRQKALSDVNKAAQDSISGIPVTKSFVIEDIMQKKYSDSVDSSIKNGAKVIKIQSVVEPFRFIMNILPFFITMIIGGIFVINGDMTLGKLFGFITLTNCVSNPASIIVSVVSSLKSSEASAERILDIWNLDDERDNGSDYSEKLNDTVMEFKNVCFGYQKDKPLINDLSFKVKKDSKVAIVGSSGCGKSTILKLILGFYDIDRGDINIFGHSVKDWNLNSLRKLFSVVSQDNFLFPVSIYENISYGKRNPNENEIYDSAKLSSIHEFISNLKDGYNTDAGERGVKLSGGQKQRIAIARAMLKNAPVLLLDEATSSLDTESENEVQNALNTLMDGRTTIVVAHRLSTIKNADSILVMDKGKVIQEGTHEELFKNCEVYRNLYMKQFDATEQVAVSD